MEIQQICQVEPSQPLMRPLLLGFRKSLSQSPTKLRLKTVTKIANPGKVTVHQACRR